MPKYVVFIIFPNRPTDKESGDDMKDNPLFQKLIHEMVTWITSEVEAERLKGGENLVDVSEESSIRVDLQTPDIVPSAEPKEPGGDIALPPPKSSVTRGHQNHASREIRAFYTAEFPTVDDVIAWAQSCPVSYDGFSLEIRALEELDITSSKMPSELKEWAGHRIISRRKELLEEGQLRRDEDGTLWARVVDDKPTKDLVAEAEKREAEGSES
ncbi:hypothetical protein GQ53DRAFT_820070 [Thozetella sp. PMI_491]|nr:hypothetical protein GQ53DRAFT_820070 [Thozetella sp. PMI_491]